MADPTFTTPSEQRAGTKPPKGRGPANKPKNTSNTVGGGTASTRTIERVKGALNPKFDPRMRNIGSPQHRGSAMKRGWIQTASNKRRGTGGGKWKNADNRVNFLFNPPAVSISSSLSDAVRSPLQVVPNDPGTQWMVGASTDLSVSLLYDRTYEMFSPYNMSFRNLAHQYGVYADVAAWYYYLHMIEEIPSAPTRTGKRDAKGRPKFAGDWAESVISAPMMMVPSHLFIGPSLVYYGYVTSIEVTYSHFSQRMIPVRCGVNIGFKVLPDQDMTAKKYDVGARTKPGFTTPSEQRAADKVTPIPWSTWGVN